MKKALKYGAAILSMLVLCAGSNATLFSLDYLEVGDSLTTYDDSSGLEWLDISETLGLSVNQLLGGSGGFLDNGFRYATTDEVFALFENNNLIVTGYGQTTSIGYVDMVNLINLLGGESDSGFSITLHGLTGNTNLDGGHRHFYFGYYYANGYDLEYWINSGYLASGPDYSSDDVGSFLVREHTVVPVPPAIWLFCSALITLATVRKRDT